VKQDVIYNKLQELQSMRCKQKTTKKTHQKATLGEIQNNHA